MLALMTSLGFTNDPDPEDPTMRRVWLRFSLPEALRAWGALRTGEAGSVRP